jgi:pimeloyl-ACP methyl ester carboxylesterase
MAPGHDCQAVGMTVVLVHGNPEVAQIWDDLIAELDRDDVVCLSPPGFGAPVPDGFGSTAPEYAEWLVAEVQQLEAPIHLIGHDWGGGHVIGALLLRPDLFASVTTDIAGCMAPGYAWHDLAQLWRTPDVGEATVAGMSRAPLPDRVALYESLGMSSGAATACADAAPQMGPSILALYRSADESTMEALGRAVADLTHKPPLHVIIATEDGYTGGEDRARATAEAWGATVHRLDGLGHWWMMEDPTAGAEVIQSIAD